MGKSKFTYLTTITPAGKRSLISLQRIDEVLGDNLVKVKDYICWNTSVNPKVGDKVLLAEADTCLPNEIDLPFGCWWRYAVLVKFLEEKRFRATDEYQAAVMDYAMLRHRLVRVGSGKEADEFEIGANLTGLFGAAKYADPNDEEYKAGAEDGNSAAPVVPKQTIQQAGIPQTEEVRVQGNQELIDRLHTKMVHVSIKKDGCSATYADNGDEVAIYGRSVKFSPEEKNHYAAIYHQEKMERLLGTDLAVQGEIVGPKINCNRQCYNKHEFFVFSIYHRKEKRFLTVYEMDNVCIGYGFKIAECLYYAKGWESFPRDSFGVPTVQNLLDYADGVIDNGCSAEGIVVRNASRSIHFKVVSPKYKAREDKTN